jgi:hypothetical protein
MQVNILIFLKDLIFSPEKMLDDIYFIRDSAVRNNILENYKGITNWRRKYLYLEKDKNII